MCDKGENTLGRYMAWDGSHVIDYFKNYYFKVMRSSFTVICTRVINIHVCSVNIDGV